MLRNVLSFISLKTVPAVSSSILNFIGPTTRSGNTNAKNILQKFTSSRFFSVIPVRVNICNKGLTEKGILSNVNNGLKEQNRSLTKFSWKSGKRKTVKAVTNRFFRLRWGIWIRTRAGRNKQLWKKSRSRKNRLKQHVFCNKQQSRMLDTMVSKYWRKPKFYIDDPYEPYHERPQFYATRNKPWRPEGCDYE